MKTSHCYENYHLKAKVAARDRETESGVKVSSEALYRLRREALHLTATPADAVNSLFPGAFQAVFHGRGLEFDEVRAYQWGDDHRSVDWRVTARTGQMHTKLYHQEKERCLYLLVDCANSMHFGTRQHFKWVLAARIAAIFAWLAIENGDRVGLILFGHQNRCEIIPPGLGQPKLLKIFQLFSQQEYHSCLAQKDLSSLHDALRHLKHLAHSDTLALIVSDFLEFNQHSKKSLSELNHHHELAVVMITDPLEEKLPKRGRYSISDGYHFCSLNVQQSGLQASYTNHYKERLQILKKLSERYHMALLEFSTEDNYLLKLRKVLRSARHRWGGSKNG